MSITVTSLALLLAAVQDAPVDPAHDAAPAPVVEEVAEDADEAPAEDLVTVAIDTTMGRIVLELDRGRAPITTANFLAYVDDGYIEFAEFYRAMPFGDTGLAQFGVRRLDKTHDPIAHEPTNETGLKHERGTIALINAGPGTGRSDFYIAMAPIPGFDCCDNGPGFAPFGRVVEGMDVVEAIYAAPIDPDKGEGVMKGQMLADPVKITGAERVDGD
ncbi:peptidylprolyl isomerase [Sphingomicrobium marinum]|uniref:peptidylprolyl isomerase n=1 Tax=Sphingomicrobium marinum TaxID=1227950 RepID=UPI00223ED2A0|nr:peptidylprolyl isomerase [Sphingomicrobium marinum]